MIQSYSGPTHYCEFHFLFDYNNRIQTSGSTCTLKVHLMLFRSSSCGKTSSNGYIFTSYRSSNMAYRSTLKGGKIYMILKCNLPFSLFQMTLTICTSQQTLQFRCCLNIFAHRMQEIHLSSSCHTIPTVQLDKLVLQQ